MSESPQNILVAMSGGVDSSVAAALLLDAGHAVEGVTMRLAPAWLPIAATATDAAIESAQSVAAHLGIPHRVADFTERFEQLVVATFASEYAAGRTPNPCVVCNQTIKFGLLDALAGAEGFAGVATGHYAQMVGTDTDGEKLLLRDLANPKDQTYFMNRVPREVLGRTWFPLAGREKPWVREQAAARGIPSAHRPESQDVCFLAGDAAHVVFERLYPQALEPGNIVTVAGERVGTHRGLATVTVGQRGGLGIGGQRDPLYVVGVDAKSNSVIVGPREEIAVTRIEVTDAVWHLPEFEAGEYLVAVRYNQRPVLAHVARTSDTGWNSLADQGTQANEGSGGFTIELSEPSYGVAGGQAAVCYSEYPPSVPEPLVAGTVALVGGGTISCVS